MGYPCCCDGSLCTCADCVDAGRSDDGTIPYCYKVVVSGVAEATSADLDANRKCCKGIIDPGENLELSAFNLDASCSDCGDINGTYLFFTNVAGWPSTKPCRQRPDSGSAPALGGTSQFSSAADYYSCEYLTAHNIGTWSCSRMGGTLLEIKKIGSDTRMLLKIHASNALGQTIYHNGDGSTNPDASSATFLTQYGAPLWFSANLGSGNTCNNLSNFELSTKSQPYWPTGGTYTDTFGGAFGSDCTQYSLPAKINTSTGEETWAYDPAGDYDDGAAATQFRGFNRICSEKAATVQVTVVSVDAPYVVDSNNMVTNRYNFPKLVVERSPDEYHGLGVYLDEDYYTTVGNPISITYTITNTGTEDLTLSSISDSAFPSGLSLVTNISDTTLSRMEQTTFVVRIDALSTTSSAVITAEIEIISDDPLYKPAYPDFPQPGIPSTYTNSFKFAVGT